MLPIHTARLHLRRFTESDLPALVTYRSDPLVARFQSWDESWSHADAVTFLADDRESRIGATEGWVQVAAELRATGELAGDVAVHTLPHTGEFEVGVTFARAHQGHGLATEALGAIVDGLFASFDARRVVAETDDRNDAVHHLLGRLGFTTLRTYQEADGVAVREFALDRAGWTAARAESGLTGPAPT